MAAFASAFRACSFSYGDCCSKGGMVRRSADARGRTTSGGWYASSGLIESSSSTLAITVISRLSSLLKTSLSELRGCVIELARAAGHSS